LTGYAYGSYLSSNLLKTAMGIYSDWTNNVYLDMLLQINPDQSYWTTAYNANQRYDLIGDYSVFVMTVTLSNGARGQDFLYISKATTTGAGTPEPASLLLWSLGGLGCLIASWKRRRQKRLRLA
jgi:hypothetical protein